MGMSERFIRVCELSGCWETLLTILHSLKVLNLVGLADSIKAESTALESFHDETFAGHLLGHSDLPKTFAEKYRQPCIGIRRTWINLALKQMLVDLKVDVREGWELVDIKETENSVTAVFDGGREVTGSFLIGCDGLKSAVRTAILNMKGKKEEPPSYTGLTQVRVNHAIVDWM